MLLGAYLVLHVFAPQSVLACSMVCFSDAVGRTWVGNNEDFIDPNTWMWTIPREQGKYGAICFGYGNRFPQGAMNEAGLVFDGFAMEPLEVVQTDGKSKITPPDLIKELMQSCRTTREVKGLMLRYRLDFLSHAQLMFVDRDGASLIVEGDAMFEKGAREPRICTNFYRSKIENEEDILCERYLRGKQLLPEAITSRNGKATCVALLESMHQSGFWGGTQYSNVYDPARGLVSVYLFHNFEEEVVLSLKELLDDGAGPIQLASLFKDRPEYDAFRAAHRKADELTSGLKGIDSPDQLRELLSQLTTIRQSRLFGSRIVAALEAQVKRERWELAKLTGELCTSLFPDSKESFAALGRAYLATEMYDAAANHVNRALKLAPEDAELVNLKAQITELIKQQEIR